MRTFYRGVLPILFIILPFLTLAQVSSTATESEVIEQIIDQSGIAEQVSETPKDVRSQFESNPFGLEASKNNRMIDLFEKAFVDDSLMKYVHSTFKEQYNADLAQAANSWLSEDTTKKVLNAEKEFHTLQGSRKRVVRMYELEQDPPSAERKEMIRSLVAATSANESIIESQTILFRSIVSAFGILSDQQTFSESQIDGIVNNYRLQIQSQVEEEVTNQLMIMYNDLDSDVLNDYISFYQTEAGKWLNTTTTEAIHSAFRAAADRFVASVKTAE